MKKIMFNDKFGLTQAVLEGRKTMTRRIIKCPRTFRGEWVAGFNIHRRHSDKRLLIGLVCTMLMKESLIWARYCRNMNLEKLLPLRKVIWMLTDFIEKGKCSLLRILGFYIA